VIGDWGMIPDRNFFLPAIFAGKFRARAFSLCSIEAQRPLASRLHRTAIVMDRDPRRGSL
jgi:hypothetical protein